MVIFSSEIYHIHSRLQCTTKYVRFSPFQTSVIMKDLLGDVTMWLESYDCGCSKNSSEKITFTIGQKWAACVCRGWGLTTNDSECV